MIAVAPHQSQYSFFALHVGGVDIFWGRQALKESHGIYYALLLSALHKGMIAGMCLSGYHGC